MQNCGGVLTPLAVCVTCKEHLTWLCDGCGRADDSVHVHADFRYPKLD